jgi:hypothetical protein
MPSRLRLLPPSLAAVLHHKPSLCHHLPSSATLANSPARSIALQCGHLRGAARATRLPCRATRLTSPFGANPFLRWRRPSSQQVRSARPTRNDTPPRANQSLPSPLLNHVRLAASRLHDVNTLACAAGRRQTLHRQERGESERRQRRGHELFQPSTSGSWRRLPSSRARRNSTLSLPRDATDTPRTLYLRVLLHRAGHQAGKTAAMVLFPTRLNKLNTHLHPAARP